MATTKKKEKLWTGDFIIHCLSYLMVFSGFYFLLPTLPIYVVSDLGENKSLVGYIIGIYALSALGVRPIAGYIFDRFGRRKTYLISLFFYVLITGTYLLANSFIILLILRFLHGISWGFITTGGATIAADIVPDSRRGEGIGYFGLSITLSMALGPMIGLWVLNNSDFQSLFLSTLGVTITALALALLIHYQKVPLTKSKIGWNNIAEKKVFSIAFVLLILAVTYGGIMSFITIYAEELHIKNIKYIFLVYALGVAIFRPFSGALMDKKGPAGLMAFSFVISILGYILLSQTNDEITFLTSCFIIGLGNGVIMPVILTMTVNVVPPNRRGVANSTVYSAADLGIGIGSIFLGYIAELRSVSEMFLICGLLMIIPMIYFFTVTLRNYKNHHIDTT